MSLHNPILLDGEEIYPMHVFTNNMISKTLHPEDYNSLVAESPSGLTEDGLRYLRPPYYEQREGWDYVMTYGDYWVESTGEIYHDINHPSIEHFYYLLDGDTMTFLCLDPLSPDTDNDGIPDGEEVKDKNGLWPDDYGFIYGYGSGVTNPLNPDTDGDGILDGAEVNFYGSDPTRIDTDSDGMTDFWEVQYALPPNIYSSDSDTDGDGYTDYAEFIADTNPIDPYSY
jgi:hypothetical protein